MENNGNNIVTPGTFVLQEISGIHCFVGLVVGNHMIDHLNEDDQEKIKVCPDEYIICLVLWWIARNEKQRESARKTFLTYCVGEKAKAISIDLKGETAMLQQHRESHKDIQSRGIREENTREAIFGYSLEQRMILELVGFSRHILEGGNDENRPDWLETLAAFERKKVVAVLAEAFVLPKRQSQSAIKIVNPHHYAVMVRVN